HLELLARLLVDVRAAVHGELLDARRQRNGAPDQRAGAAGGIRDLAGRLVEHPMIECLQTNADILSFHVQLPMSKSHGRSLSGPSKQQETAPPRQTSDGSVWEGAAPQNPGRANPSGPARRGAYITS